MRNPSPQLMQQKKTPKEYSDDESDDEIGFDKPQDKTLPSATPLVPLSTTTSKITSVSESHDSVSVQIKEEVKLPTDSIKSIEKPKSPTDLAKSVPKDYSDDESDEEFETAKPHDKSHPQPVPSHGSLLSIEDKSLQKSDDILKPLTDLKDIKFPTKFDEKPKSPTDATKKTPKEYSDDESDDEIGFNKPQDKTLPSTTPLVLLSTTTSKITSKSDDILKPLTDLKDIKSRTKIDEKPKSPTDATKKTPKEYSDDESDDEIGFDKPQDKTLPSATPLVPLSTTTSKITSVSESHDSVSLLIKEEVKLPTDPIKSIEKPKSPTDVVKIDASDMPHPQPVPSHGSLLSIEDKSLQKSDDILKPLTDLKDIKFPTKFDEKPKSPTDATKKTPKEYSDDESDDEIGFDKPQDKTLPSATPLVPLSTTTSKITSVSESHDSVSLLIKEEVKLPTDPIKSIEKSKSPTDVVKTDVSDMPHPQPVPSTGSLLPIGDKSLQKSDDILKPLTDLKDIKSRTKIDEKPKSPTDATKKTPKEYSDDESDDEIGFDKPQDKTLPSATPLVPLSTTTSKITSVKEEVKLPTDPIKSIEKPKLPTDLAESVPKYYSDDDVEELLETAKPHDKPYPQPVPSTDSLLPIGDKSLPKSDDILKPLTDLKDIKSPTKIDEKPKSPIDATKKTPKEYSDDESDDEIGFDNPQDKTLPSATPLVPLSTTTSKITSVSESHDSVSVQIKEEVKLPTDPIQSIEKPKSPTDVVKTDTSDMPHPQPVPSTGSLLPIGDKSLPKSDDILKPLTDLKDIKSPTKIDEKPKSPIDATRKTPKEYSDDESDDEIGFDKPQDKTLPSATPLVPLSTTTSKITSVSESHDSVSVQVKEEVKLPSDPIKSIEKPKSPTDVVKTDTSDMPHPQPVPSTGSLLPIGDKSLPKSDDILKPLTDLKDIKSPTKIDEKPKSPIDATRKTPKEYSDDESDDEIGFDKPQDKTLPSATPLVPLSTTTSKITSVSESHDSVSVQVKEEVKLPTDPIKSIEKPKLPTDLAESVPKYYSDDDSDEEFETAKPHDKPYPQPVPLTGSLLPIGDKSLPKSDDILKPLTDLKDIKSPTKIDEKPKSPIDATRKTPKEYSDDESDDEIGFDKPQDKTLPSATPLVPLSTTTSKITSIDNKKIVRKTVSKMSGGSTIRSSIEPKLQKQMKDTMNESSTTASGSTSASGSSNSTRRSVRSVLVSRKTDKEKTNMKLSEKKGVAMAATMTSTVRAHREPTATTGAVSTVLVDDDSEVITIRSIKSSDSTKSSTSSSSGSGSNSRKVLTSEVFTKTLGPDKPLEVIYRQPDFDVEHHTSIGMRPQSTSDQQRYVNEFDVSFIDTTDSSLSDSVALPMFGPGEPERLLAASPGSPKPTRSPLALIEETLRRHHHQHQHIAPSVSAVDPSQQVHVESVSLVAVSESRVKKETEQSSTSKGK
ncbi:GH23702 [Drosophila grimshawi]|uniref:GH23702 n=1 Tax=Drosophila grimshawi TaxID=7222 RepID=B4K0W1_DROGR|nr:GH23702 [Drosophila grimshawi]